MANILASKIITFLWWSVPGGVIVFSTTFLLTDMISEFYGKKEAKRAVWAGFFASILYIFSTLIVMYWQPAPFWQNQEAFASVLGLSFRITIASLLTYLISQFNDVYLYHWIKKKTKGKHLWLRNCGSTLVSQALDTVIFITIAFYGLFPILPMMIGLYVVKVLVALIDTPFLYIVRRFWDNDLRLRR